MSQLATTEQPSPLPKAAEPSSVCTFSTFSLACKKSAVAVLFKLMIRPLLLLGGCVFIGVGIALLLAAALGSDGLSTMVHGLSMTLAMPYWAVNVAVAGALVAVAWWRGLPPGPASILTPVCVGPIVSVVGGVLGTPSDPALRAALLLAALPITSIGVAVYLAADYGAGPAEAVAIALDPPVPLRWSLGIVQGAGALIGWLCGADVGVGTLLLVVGLGPTVAWFGTRFPVLHGANVTYDELPPDESGHSV